MQSKWAFRSVAILFALAIFGGVLGYLGWVTPAGPASGTTFSSEPESPPESSLRIGTFNIDGGKGTDQVVDLHRTAKALQKLDFIGLNEVHAAADGNQAAEIGHILELPFLYAPAERRWGRNAFGNGVLSRLKITKWERVQLSNARWHALRNYVLTQADWDGRPIWFLTTHVDFKVGGEAQKSAVIERFLALPMPCVLMGDLNSPPADGAIKRLRATPGVTEAVSAVLDEIPKRVDWIFVRGLKVVDAGQVDIGASDHPAYWAQVRRETPTSGPIDQTEGDRERAKKIKH